MKTFTYFGFIIFFGCSSPEVINDVSTFSNCILPDFEYQFSCNSKLENFQPPDLITMIEGVDYIILDPSLINGDSNYDVRGFSCCEDCINPCSEYNQCCLNYFPFTGSNKTWEDLLISKLRQTPTIRYVLFKPGDYRCLGPLCIRNRNNPDKFFCNQATVTNPASEFPNLYLTFYDDLASNPFLPLSNCSAIYTCYQAIMENIVLHNSQNIFINGLLFDGIQPLITNGARKNIFEYYSNNCTFSNCIFQNYFINAIEVRSSSGCTIQNCIFRNSSHCIEHLCSDPVCILVNCDHLPGGSSDCERVNSRQLVNCYNTRIINNIFYNVGQAFQSVYGGPNCNPPDNCLSFYCPEAVMMECQLAGINGSIICGNKSFRSNHSYRKYEGHFTFKLGSSNSLLPVIFKENYMELGCALDGNFCPLGNGIGASGQGVDLERFCRNIFIYRNHFNKLNTGIQASGLYGLYCWNNSDINSWPLYVIQNYFNCIQSCFENQNTSFERYGIGIVMPIYRLQDFLALENCFVNSKQPMFILDGVCNVSGYYNPLYTCITANYFSNWQNNDCYINDLSTGIFISSQFNSQCYLSLAPYIYNNDAQCNSTLSNVVYNINFPIHFGYNICDYIRNECSEPDPHLGEH